MTVGHSKYTELFTINELYFIIYCIFFDNVPYDNFSEINFEKNLLAVLLLLTSNEYLVNNKSKKILYCNIKKQYNFDINDNIKNINDNVKNKIINILDELIKNDFFKKYDEIYEEDYYVITRDDINQKINKTYNVTINVNGDEVIKKLIVNLLKIRTVAHNNLLNLHLNQNDIIKYNSKYFEIFINKIKITVQNHILTNSLLTLQKTGLNIKFLRNMLISLVPNYIINDECDNILNMFANSNALTHSHNNRKNIINNRKNKCVSNLNFSLSVHILSFLRNIVNNDKYFNTLIKIFECINKNKNKYNAITTYNKSLHLIYLTLWNYKLCNNKIINFMTNADILTNIGIFNNKYYYDIINDYIEKVNLDILFDNNSYIFLPIYFSKSTAEELNKIFENTFYKKINTYNDFCSSFLLVINNHSMKDNIINGLLYLQQKNIDVLNNLYTFCKTCINKIELNNSFFPKNISCLLFNDFLINNNSYANSDLVKKIHQMMYINVNLPKNIYVPKLSKYINSCYMFGYNNCTLDTYLSNYKMLFI